MKVLRSERGAALLYVLMIITVLLIMIPSMLSIASNRLNTNMRDELAKKATDLAVSSLESLLSYLDTTQSVNYETHFENYPGWGDYMIQQPDGGSVHYQFGPMVGTTWQTTTPDVTASNTQKTKIRLKVTAEKGNLSGEKELYYDITVPAGSGSGDTGSGGSNTVVNGETNVLVNILSVPQRDLGSVVVGEVMTTDIYPGGSAAYEQDYQNLLPKQPDILYQGAACSSWQSTIESDFANFTLAPEYDTVTIQVDCGNVTILNKVITLLNISTKKNVILHIKNGSLTLDGSKLDIDSTGDLDLDGMLIVDGDLLVKNNALIEASNIILGVNSEYKETGNGNSIIYGTVTAGEGIGNSHDPSIILGGTGNNESSQNEYNYLNSSPATGTSPWDPVIAK